MVGGRYYKFVFRLKLFAAFAQSIHLQAKICFRSCKRALCSENFTSAVLKTEGRFTAVISTPQRQNGLPGHTGVLQGTNICRQKKKKKEKEKKEQTKSFRCNTSPTFAASEKDSFVAAKLMSSLQNYLSFLQLRKVR